MKPLKRLVFAGTPWIAAEVLEALCVAGYPLVGCLTQPDRKSGRGQKYQSSPVKMCAQRYGLPVGQPKTLRDNDSFSWLADLKPDLLIVLAYGLILPPKVLDLPLWGCINIHASLLPRWRGAAPIVHAILAGDTQTGITTMQMDAGLDTGAILKQYPCDILPEDTSADLLYRLSILSQTAILDTLSELCQGTLQPRPQSEAGVCYASKIQKADADLDWFQSAQQLSRCVRAYQPQPVAHTHCRGTRLRIWHAVLLDPTALAARTGKPGEVLDICSEGIAVGTGDGILQIKSLQFPAKSVLSGQALAQAAHERFRIGDVFSQAALA